MMSLAEINALGFGLVPYPLLEFLFLLFNLLRYGRLIAGPHDVLERIPDAKAITVAQGKNDIDALQIGARNTVAAGVLPLLRDLPLSPIRVTGEGRRRCRNPSF